MRRLIFQGRGKEGGIHMNWAMRISTKTHLDSVRILELARSSFRWANPHPPFPTYTCTIYFTDEKTESLPLDISSYNSSACFEKKTRCENTRSRSTCGEDCRWLGKIFPSPYLSIFDSLPVKHIYYFCKKKKKSWFYTHSDYLVNWL